MKNCFAVINNWNNFQYFVQVDHLMALTRRIFDNDMHFMHCHASEVIWSRLKSHATVKWSEVECDQVDGGRLGVILASSRVTFLYRSDSQVYSFPNRCVKLIACMRQSIVFCNVLWCALRAYRRSCAAVKGRTVYGHRHVKVVYTKVNCCRFVLVCCYTLL